MVWVRGWSYRIIFDKKYTDYIMGNKLSGIMGNKTNGTNSTYGMNGMKLYKGGYDERFNTSTLVLYFLLSALFIVFSIYSFMDANIEFICICCIYSVHVLFTLIFCFGVFTNRDIMKGFMKVTGDAGNSADGLYGESQQYNSLFLLASISGLLIGIITLTFIIVMYAYMRDYYNDENNPLQYLTKEHADMLYNYKIVYMVTTGLSLVLGVIFAACYLEDMVVFIRNVAGIIITMAIISFCVLQIIWGKSLLDIKLNHLVS